MASAPTPGGTVAANVRGMVQNQERQRVIGEQNELKAQMQQILPEVGKRVAAGDAVGAFEIASQIPGFTQTPAGQQLFQSLFPQREAPDEVQSIQEVVNDQGQSVKIPVFKSGKAGSAIGQAPAPAAEPLRPFQFEALTEASNMKDKVEQFTGLGKKLIEQKRAFGPIEGRGQEFLSFLGAADPDVAEFIANRDVLALNLAAVVNQGRPSDKDKQAIDKFLAELKQNPASAIRLLDGAMAASQNALSNAFVFNMEAALPSQRKTIEGMAKLAGVDINQELALRAKAQQEKVPLIEFRRQILAGERTADGKKLGDSASLQGREVKVGQVVEMSNKTDGSKIRLKITGRNNDGSAKYEVVK